MLEVAVTGALIPLYLLVAHGWGDALCRSALGSRLPFAFTACVGLALLLAMGGVLNFAGLAHGPMLDSIALVGLGLAIRAARSQGLPRGWRLPRRFAAELIPVFVPVFVFVGLALLRIVLHASPEAFNFHDDFEKYLAHPARMLATGTLAGSDFNALGTETLGGQAFLQAFALRHFGLAYVNSVDGVFAAVLCLLMLLHLQPRKPLGWLLVSLCMVFLVVLPDFYVNVSSIYTGAAMIMAMLALPVLLESDGSATATATATATTTTTATTTAARVICTALLYAALLSLKTSLVLVPLVHLAGLAVMSYRRDMPCVRQLPALAGVTVLVLIPWLAAHVDPAALVTSLGAGSITGDGFPGQPVLLPPRLLLSQRPFGYGFGVTFLDLTMVIVFVSGASAIVLSTRATMGGATGPWLATGVLIGCYVVSVLVVAPNLLGLAHGVRYFAPVMVAATPLILVVALHAHPVISARRAGASLCVVAVVCMALLARPAYERTLQQIELGHALSFTWLVRDLRFIEFNDEALSRNVVGEAQRHTPPGSTVLTWTLFNFQLDYARNRIIDVDPAGLATPWLGFPLPGGFEDQRAYLNELGVDYMLVQHRGYAARSRAAFEAGMTPDEPRTNRIAAKGIAFIEFVNELARRAEVVFADDRFVVLKMAREG